MLRTEAARYTFKTVWQALHLHLCVLRTLVGYADSAAAQPRLLRSLVSFADKSAYWEYFGYDAPNFF